MKNNIFYIIEIANNGELYYVFNKRILLHTPELSKKFSNYKEAYNYYKTSKHFNSNSRGSIVKYDKTTDRVIY